MGYARDAEIGDIALLKDHLRKPSIDEMWALHRYTPEQSLLYSFANSVFSFSIVSEGDILAMGGILKPKDILADRAALWFLTSQKLDKVERSFLRQCKTFMQTMLEIYPVLYNYVDLRNDPAIRWLKWIGATFGDVFLIGIDNQPFVYFEFKKNDP